MQKIKIEILEVFSHPNKKNIKQLFKLSIISVKVKPLKLGFAINQLIDYSCSLFISRTKIDFWPINTLVIWIVYYQKMVDWD